MCAATGRDETVRDVIVIGAGGGGTVVAKELAARGLDVLLLEAGPRFADVEREWSHFETEANNAILGYFRFGPADLSRPAFRRDLPQNSFVWQGSGVGGTTQIYYGNSPRALPGAFLDYEGADRDAYDTAHRFPFGYRELIPYYEWVEGTLPVETAPIGRKEAVFLEGAARIGLRFQKTKDTVAAAFRPQENAILQSRGRAGRSADPLRQRHPRARGCTFCGHCTEGCFVPLGAPRNLKAKRSTDTSYVPMALTADRWARGGRAATLVTDAFVVRIDTDETGTARGVTWRVGTTGERLSEEAHVVAMAGGCTENPRLWLTSGLPNPNGQVGRGYTNHFMDMVIGVMPFETGSSAGPGSAARVDYPGRGGLENVGLPPANQATIASLSNAGMAGLYHNGRAGGAHGADTVGRLVGRDLKDLLANLPRLLNVLVITDDDVEAQNRITLSTAPPDEHGPIPRVEIASSARSARTIANREFLATEAVRLLRAAGATRVHRIDWPPLVVHPQSTMRMGTDEADSVLDDQGEARWVPRLFVADNSALANALGGPNPTLTTQALATRTAEAIFRRYFGGVSWVCREAPRSSVSRRVTRAVLERGL